MAQIMNRALKLARIYYNLEPIEMANRVNITPEQLKQIELNFIGPSLGVIEQYAIALEVPKEQLIFFSDYSLPGESYLHTRGRLWIASRVLDLLEFILKIIR